MVRKRHGLFYQNDLFKWSISKNPGSQIQVNYRDLPPHLNNSPPSTCHSEWYLHAYQNSPVISNNNSRLFLSKTRQLLTQNDTGLWERHNLAHYEERNWSSVVARMLSEINSASGGRPPPRSSWGAVMRLITLAVWAGLSPLIHSRWESITRPRKTGHVEGGGLRGRPFHHSGAAQCLKSEISQTQRIVYNK